MTKLTVGEKVRVFENRGWRYNHDGENWTSGSWWHDEYGIGVNQQGGSFRCIADAVAAMERFLISVKQIERDSKRFQK